MKTLSKRYWGVVTLLMTGSVFVMMAVWPTPFTHAAGLVPGAFPVSSGTELEIKDTVTVNGTIVSKGKTGVDSVIQPDGTRDTISQTLPTLEPSTFPGNSSNTNATEADTPFISSTDVFFNKITIAKNQSATFIGGGPFHIDTLDVQKEATLNFAAGTYFIDTLKIAKDSRLILTSESVILHIGQTGDVKKDVVMNSGGTVPGLRVFLHSGATLKADKGFNFTGLVYGPANQKVELNKDTVFHGAIITEGKIKLEKDIVMTYTAADQTAVSAINTADTGGGNSPPVADAGPDQTVQVTDTVQLDGSDSTDVNGDLLTYSWTLLSQPAGSTVTLNDPTSVMPTLVADAPGSYEIELIVNDGTVASEPDTVTITTTNSPPAADAGPDQTVFVTQTVLLNGTNSSDVDGDGLTFLWSFMAIPSGSTAILFDPTSSTPSFTVDFPGTYEVQLIVNDGTANSAPDEVVINTQNSKPVAQAGSDQTVPIGHTVQLNGSNSSDVDGDPLTYLWALIAMPAGSAAILSDVTAGQPTFVTDLPGIYVGQLMVNDGTEDSNPATVTITTGNTPPVAEAGPDQTVSVQTLVTLNGNGSHDPDGDALTFQWSLNNQPVGSTATVLNSTFAQPTFIPDLPGTYVVQLLVSDGLTSSSPDSVAINAQATPVPALPSLIINSPADGIVVGGSPITVSGFVSDPTATVIVNGVSATVTGGVFLADGIALQGGSNTITVSGTDGQGNNNSVSVMVTLSSASPTYLDPLWGPIEWVKQTPDEELFTANFSNCELSAQYELVVINGTSGGANRVSQGTVLLNGVEVISAQDFTAAQAQITQPIVVQATNDLEVRLQGPIGAQVQAFITCTANCLSVSIDAPLADATINQPTMVVNGSINSSSSTSPLGVVVNQQGAKVFGSTYAVDGVPMREGTGTLGSTTVVAQVTNACGLRASASLQVQTTDVPTNQVQLRASPDRNVAPSEVTMRVSLDIEQPVALIQWDHQGDGIIDAQGPDLLEQTVTFTQPGLYQPNVIVTDDFGETFGATAVVLVEDAAAFETMLNAKWSGMMDALAQGDIEQALRHIHSRKREVIRHDWTVLKDHLGELATTFDVPLQLTDGQGFRVVAQSATPITMGTIQFPLEIEFVLDTDGQWRIRSF